MAWNKAKPKRFWTIVIVAAGWLAAMGSARADEPTLTNVPPVVVGTSPKAGATDIAAGPAEIKVTFSKPMRAGGWSWSKVSDASFPKLNGQPHYSADRKTCVLPVILEAAKTYAVWLNLAPAENFTDDDGRKAVPYVLVFHTK